jgi:hypothetical protein
MEIPRGRLEAGVAAVVRVATAAAAAVVVVVLLSSVAPSHNTILAFCNPLAHLARNSTATIVSQVRLDPEPTWHHAVDSLDAMEILDEWTSAPARQQAVVNWLIHVEVIYTTAVRAGYSSCGLSFVRHRYGARTHARRSPLLGVVPTPPSRRSASLVARRFII